MKAYLSAAILIILATAGCKELESLEAPLNPGDEKTDKITDTPPISIEESEVLYPYAYEHKALYMRDADAHSLSGDIFIIDGDQSTLFVKKKNDTELSIVSNHVRGKGPLFSEPSSVAVDEVNSKVYVGAQTDGISNRAAIFEIDIASGDRRLIASQDYILAPDLWIGNLYGIEVDPSRNRVLIENNSTIGSIIAVDIASGERSVFSGGTRGTGDAFNSPAYFSIDVNNDTLYVSDTSLDVYFKVDLETGNRSILSSNLVGSGVEISYTGDLHFDQTTNSLFTKTNVVLRIDTQNGDRSLITGGGRGNENGYLPGSNRVLGNSAGQIFLLNSFRNTLVQAEQANGDLLAHINFQTGTGDYTLRGGSGIVDNTGEYIFTGSSWVLSKIKVSDGSRVQVSAFSKTSSELVGAGPNISIDYLDYDASSGKFYAGGIRSLFSIDETTGDRTIISSDTIGTGDYFLDYRGLAFDSSNNRVLTFSNYNRKLYGINISNGNRTVISSDTVGTGPLLGDISDAKFNSARTTAYALLKDSHKIIAVDTSTGNRTELFDISTVISTSGLDLTCLAIDFTNNFAYLCNSLEQAILKLDLNTGTIDVVTSKTKGVGPGRDVNHETRLIVDQSNGQLYISSWGLLSVDMTTGDRYSISN